MFRLTCIELDNGEFAVYINHHYLGVKMPAESDFLWGGSGAALPAAGRGITDPAGTRTGVR
jgi:hypothetical protein